MATILDGKKIADMRLGILKEDIEDSGLFPRLATVIAGADPASQMYIRMKHRACEQVGSARLGGSWQKMQQLNRCYRLSRS
jgi:methylenetetrahydrofolate dehydrogenase (NADP+)/methenyltetrahydrofolate cyclohydrolase